MVMIAVVLKMVVRMVVVVCVVLIGTNGRGVVVDCGVVARCGGENR